MCELLLFRRRVFLGLLALWLDADAAGSARSKLELYNLQNYSLVSSSPGGACRVLHAPAGAGSFEPPAGLLEPFDVVITDDEAHVEFMTMKGKFYFLEDRSYPLMDVGRTLAQMKETLPLDMRREGMSVLFPKEIQTEEMQMILEDASQMMPGSIFIDDGTFEGRHAAFYNFTFTALINQDRGTPPQSVVDCIAHGSVPMLVGRHNKLNYSQYFPYSVVKFADFSIEHSIAFMLKAPEDAFYVYSNSLKMTQEFFHLRYRHPFAARLWRHANAACQALEVAGAPPPRPLAFVSIYSALKNFGRRMALRETWLPFLKSVNPRVMYKFFLADTSLDGKEIDRIARSERDLFDDMVFLSGTTDEYPIGRKGLAALKWVARHTEAQFWLKLDDDLYLRPQPLFDRLRRMQRAEAYWGAFDYSGKVVRDPTDSHYTSPEVWNEEVFMPYARGAALALSMDLVRMVVEQEERQPFKKIVIEDVSYGFFIWQSVVDRNLGSVTLIDGDEKRFSMDAKCCSEETHPNNCWLPLLPGTWIVHHVSPSTIRCMFSKDTAAGFYQPAAASQPNLEVEALILEMAAYDVPLEQSLSLRSQQRWTHAAGVDWNGQLPDLCGCVVTPPPHPGQPLQQGGLKEFAAGPRLHVG